MPAAEYVKCNLCGRDSCAELRPSTVGAEEPLTAQDLSCTNIRHRRHHRIVRCGGCGLMYSNPRDPSDLLDEFYKDVEDDLYLSESAGRIRTFNRCIKELNKHRKGGRLLDVGCYTGLFAAMASSEGWDVRGIEPSRWAASVARDKYKVDVVSGNISDLARMEDGSFDVITMWDVIEHLADPYGALRICGDKICDGGFLALSTMRCEGLFYSVSGALWPWFMRMHLFYFTLETLSGMLKKAGFRIIRARPYVHYISLNYFFYKMAAMKGSAFLKKFIFPVNMGDFMEVYAVKEKQ